MRINVKYPIIAGQYIASAVLLVFGIGFIAMFAAPLIGISTWGPIAAFRRLGDPVVSTILQWLSLSNYVAELFAPLVLGIFFLLLRQILDVYLSSMKKQYILAEAQSASLQPANEWSTGSPAPGVIADPEYARKRDKLLKRYTEATHAESVQFVVAAPDSEKRREDLLKRYLEIEQALKKSSKKNCTFLSADVVGSTKMKLGQKETDIASTFHAYETMLKKIFADYGAWKEAWTPDGVMICFLDRELAVGAARRILENLERFNANFNKLPIPFSVRCGINEGEVAIFEDSKLERVADRVIDVAGHMQKEAPADRLWLGAHVYERLEDKTGFKSVERDVDGHAVFEWSCPRS